MADFEVENPLSPFGHAIPSAPGHVDDHSVTTHTPRWSSIVAIGKRDPKMMAFLYNLYPRMAPHRKIKELAAMIAERFSIKDQSSLIFTAPESASQFIEWVSSPRRGMEPNDKQIPSEVITVKAIEIRTTMYVVSFPKEKAPDAAPFWSHPGVGISSRRAEDAIKHVEFAREVSVDDPPKMEAETSSHRLIRERIAQLLERAPVGPVRSTKVSPDDVYLFPTGMAALYRPLSYIRAERDGIAVQFGFAFHSTFDVVEEFGTGGKAFALGDEQDLDNLEKFLEIETQEGRSVHSLTAEFPSNPGLAVPDLKRLRQLADKYHFILMIDDTISSFCSVDVLSIADILWTSLTKSFSGYADVIAGSAVLNPSSPRHSELKAIFRKYYRNELYSADAEQLEKNSRDYLVRSTILNKNALALADHLAGFAKDPNSSVKAVGYPTLVPTKDNYTPFMRPETPEFKPGYGCLLSVEFEDEESTIAFYDNLLIFQGPHLGAHRTLSLAYVRGIYAEKLEWARALNMRSTMIRVSAGLEETDSIIEIFSKAVAAADQVKKDNLVQANGHGNGKH